MQFILAILIFMLAACSAGSSKNYVEGKVPAANNPKELTDEDKFINDELFRSDMIESCLSSQRHKSRTSYGNWYELKNCNIRLNNINIQNLDISIHKDDKGRVNGLEFLVLPSTDYGLFLNGRQRHHSVRETSNTCSKYYRNTLPFFALVDKSLCDSLRYNQI